MTRKVYVPLMLAASVITLFALAVTPLWSQVAPDRPPSVDAGAENLEEPLTIIPASYVIWVLIAIHHPPTDPTESNPAVVGVFASGAACETMLDEYVRPQRTEYEKARCYSTRSPHLSGIHLLEQAKIWGLDRVISQEMKMLRENCESYYVPCEE